MWVAMKTDPNLGSWGPSEKTPLQQALKKDHKEVVKILLDAKADPNLPKSSPDFFWGIYFEKPDITKMLLEAKADLNATDSYGFTLLYRSVLDKYSKKRLENTRFLLKAKADPNILYAKKSSPLEEAVFQNHIPLIHLLLEFKADPNKYSSDLLYRSIRQHNSFRATRALLKAGITQSFAKKDFNDSIHSAILVRNLKSLKLLLDFKADPNGCFFQVPALTEAARATSSSFSMIRALLYAKADPNPKTNTPPLLAAIFKRNQEGIKIVKLLLQFKADPNLLVIYPFLERAIDENVSFSVIQALLQAGADSSILSKTKREQSTYKKGALMAQKAFLKTLSSCEFLWMGNTIPGLNQMIVSYLF